MRVGLIGCGGIARDGYLPALAYLRPGEVLLWDVQDSAMASAAVKLKDNNVIARQCIDLPALVAESDRVIVAVPPANLVTVIDSISQATSRPRPLPVLAEKPMGLSALEAGYIWGARDRLGLHYMETFIHSTAYSVMLDELLSGRYGEIRKVTLAVRGSTPSHLDLAWRGDRDQGGGVLHDWGIHSLGLAIDLFFSIGIVPSARFLPSVSVDAASWARFGNRNVLTDCTMSLHDLPVEISVRAAWDTAPAMPATPDVLIECEKGDIALLVRKTDGSSDWVCLDDPRGSARCLASRRYPKELFIRGVSGFIRRPPGADPSRTRYDPVLGLMAIEIADAAHNEAQSNHLTSSG